MRGWRRQGRRRQRRGWWCRRRWWWSGATHEPFVRRAGGQLAGQLAILFGLRPVPIRAAPATFQHAAEGGAVGRHPVGCYVCARGAWRRQGRRRQRWRRRWARRRWRGRSRGRRRRRRRGDGDVTAWTESKVQCCHHSSAACTLEDGNRDCDAGLCCTGGVRAHSVRGRGQPTTLLVDAAPSQQRPRSWPLGSAEGGKVHGAGLCRQVDHRGRVRDPACAGQCGSRRVAQREGDGALLQLPPPTRPPPVRTGMAAVPALLIYPCAVGKVVDVQRRRRGAWAIADQR